jgi:hypothetical protein
MNHLPVNFNYPINAILSVLSRYEVKATVALDPKKTLLLSKMLNLDNVLSILYFQLDPGFVGSIHKDGDLNLDGKTPQFALNLPLQNCDKTFMHWYKQLPETETSIFPGITDSNGRIPWLQKNDGVKVESAICNRPNFVKVENWHSVDNYDTSLSKFISVRFALDVTVEKLLAGDVGIEPTMSISKTDALTTWLIPNK